MPKILNIDSSNNKKIEISLNIDGKKKSVSMDTSILRSQAVLPLIDKIFKDFSISITDLDEVFVNVGPGSFTGLRVGVSIANALGFLLQIPINGKKIGELENAVYNK